MTAIELKNIHYTYPLSEEYALEDISATFEKGRLYGIVGPNGGGKTTLCNLIRGLVPNFYQGELIGEVIIDGQPMSQIDYDELSVRVGYIFQNHFTQISGVKDTVFEEIAMGLENLGIPRDEMIEKTVAIIQQLGIEDISKNNPNALSGGQKQRVAFASVVVMNPPIIVIDEPTSQLDPFGTEMIFEIIHKLKEQGKTILLVEHKTDLLAEYADDILVLDKGRLVAKGPVEEIFTDHTLLSYGANIPQVAKLGLSLKHAGLPLTDIPITIQQATHTFKKYLGKEVER